MRTIIFNILFMIAFTQFSSAQNQRVLKVVTRQIEKEYRYQNEFLLEINAEKADIEIIVTDGHSVKLLLEQTAKNEDVRIAENDLKAIHFVERKERNRLYLHNYAQLHANSTGLFSIINNKYTIEIPHNCHLKITNELGNIVIDGVSTTMRFNLNYCSLTLNNAGGKLYVDSRIGDVKLNDCHLDGEFVTQNVNMKLQRVGGSYDFQSQFGTLSCMMSEQVTLINASFKHCETTLINRTSIDYSYAIDVEKAHINALDEILKGKIEENTTNTSLHYSGEQNIGTVIIKSEYGDVNLY